MIGTTGREEAGRVLRSTGFGRVAAALFLIGVLLRVFLLLGVGSVNVTVTPETATNDVGTEHTITVTFVLDGFKLGGIPGT